MHEGTTVFNNQPEERKENLLIKNVNTKTYGKKGRSSLSPEIWNSLPEHIKVATSFTVV